MQIFVNNWSGQTIIINMEVTESIAVLKQKIFEKDGLPVEHQRLLYAGKQLEDHRSLESYGYNGTTICLAGRLYSCKRCAQAPEKDEKKSKIRCSVM